MKESTTHCVFLTVALIVVSLVAREVAGYPTMESGSNINIGPYASNIPSSPLQPNPDVNIKDLPYPPAATQIDPRMRLYLLSWLQSVGYPMDRLKVKRACLINAGLSHGCDYQDTMNALHDGLWLGSDQTPGRK